MTLVQALALVVLSEELQSVTLCITLAKLGTSCQGAVPEHVRQMDIGQAICQLAIVSMIWLS